MSQFGRHGTIESCGIAKAAYLKSRRGQAEVNFIMPADRVFKQKGVIIKLEILGVVMSVHVLSSPATVRHIVNMSALALAGVEIY